ATRSARFRIASRDGIRGLGPGPGEKRFVRLTKSSQVRLTAALLDLHPAAEALDRDPRVAVADHERERPARSGPPPVSVSPAMPSAVVALFVVRDPRGEVRIEAAAPALHVEARRRALGQPQHDRTAEAPRAHARALRERGFELDAAR